MADPMFDKLHTLFGAVPPAPELWESNLPDRATGWNSLNLKRIALVLCREHATRTGLADRAARCSEILLEKLRTERAGAFGDDPPETWGRVYPDWNARAVLVEYRQARALGLEEEAQLAAGWLRSLLAGCVLAAGSGPARKIEDHRIADAEADRGVPICGTGVPVLWYDPFVATCGPRGCQRTRDARHWGEWQMLDESAGSAWVAAATGLPLEVTRHRWIDLWQLLPALDGRYPCPEAPFGLTAEETATARRAFEGDVAAQVALAGWLWATRVTFRWVRTTEGVLMQRDRARGSSTADLDACAWRKTGKTVFLCGDPGWRHSKEVPSYVREGSCRLEHRDGRFVAIASREGREDVEADLLGGEVLFDCTTGPEGPRVAFPAQEAPPAPQEPPPTPPATPTLPTPRKRRRGGLLGLLARLFGGGR